MISRICQIHGGGHSLNTCLKLTRRQIRALYGETYRQEARIKLRWIEAIKLALAQYDDVKDTMESIRIQAYPPDPEEDGEMDFEKLRNLDVELHKHENLIKRKTGEKAGFIDA